MYFDAYPGKGSLDLLMIGRYEALFGFGLEIICWITVWAERFQHALLLEALSL